MILDTVFRNQDMTFGSRLGNFRKAHSGFLHQFFKRFLLFYLKDNPRILGKENLHHIRFVDLIQIHLQTTFHIGKTHLKQGRNHTTGRNIVTSQNQALFDSVLHGIESIAEIFRIHHGRHLVTHSVQGLCQGRTAQFQLIEREIDII